jgi:hypothetical protein
MTPWTGNQPVARPMFTQGNTEKMQTYIYALNGILTHDPRVRAGEDIFRAQDRTTIVIDQPYINKIDCRYF